MIHKVAAVIVQNNCILLKFTKDSKNFDSQYDLPIWDCDQYNQADMLKENLNSELGINCSLIDNFIGNNKRFNKFDLKLFKVSKWNGNLNIKKNKSTYIWVHKVVLLMNSGCLPFDKSYIQYLFK